MTTPPSRRSPHVRCRLCGHVLPCWLPLPDVPDGSMLLPHLVKWHPVEVTSVLQRLATGTEDIGTVAMECFERVEG
jgi:hypothetical protein